MIYYNRGVSRDSAFLEYSQVTLMLLVCRPQFEEKMPIKQVTGDFSIPPLLLVHGLCASQPALSLLLPHSL